MHPSSGRRPVRRIRGGGDLFPSKFVPEEEFLVSLSLFLVLEDSFNGVRAGAAGGFITVMVPDLDQPTPEIDGLYTKKAENLEEVLEFLRRGQL